METSHQALSHGLRMSLLSKVLKVLSFVRTRLLESVLEDNEINTNDVWNKILADGGSVQDVKQRCLMTMIRKEVFKTFKEINQLELVRQAGIRQQYIDQSVSLNLAFPSEATPKWINKVHMDAWRKGVKTLYYMQSIFSIK